MQPSQIVGILNFNGSSQLPGRPEKPRPLSFGLIESSLLWCLHGSPRCVSTWVLDLCAVSFFVLEHLGAFQELLCCEGQSTGILHLAYLTAGVYDALWNPSCRCGITVVSGKGVSPGVSSLLLLLSLLCHGCVKFASARFFELGDGTAARRRAGIGRRWTTRYW